LGSAAVSAAHVPARGRRYEFAVETTTVHLMSDERWETKESYKKKR